MHTLGESEECACKHVRTRKTCRHTHTHAYEPSCRMLVMQKAHRRRRRWLIKSCIVSILTERTGLREIGQTHMLFTSTANDNEQRCEKKQTRLDGTLIVECANIERAGKAIGQANSNVTYVNTNRLCVCMCAVSCASKPPTRRRLVGPTRAPTHSTHLYDEKMH